MSRYTYISAGSSTTVLSGPGKLYSIHITPVAGSTLLVADSKNLGASPTFNSDADPSGGVLIGRFGPYGGTTTDYLDFKGASVNDGITVAATSNARLTVLYGEG